MKFLVVQHISIEHPGIFCEFMHKGGVSWDTVELDEGENIPALDSYDALLVMGGPMDVFEEDLFPWLKNEKKIIRHWVNDLHKPYLGICLGHQLLAASLDGKVCKMIEPEVGVMDVTLTKAGKVDRLMKGVSNSHSCLQWHGCEITKLPNAAEVLAKSKKCANQAIRVGNNAWGLQYHLEITENTISQWGAIPSYLEGLQITTGQSSLDPLDKAVSYKIDEFHETAHNIYKNFIEIVSDSK